MVTYNQSGYVGCSMSVRAAQAYEMGEKPLSKWRKGEIVSLARDAYGEDFAKEMAKRPLFQLKDELLYNSSWHHTGSFANKTEFYAFDSDKGEEELKEILSYPILRAEKKKVGDEKWAVGWYEWTENRGSRNHPHLYDCSEIVLVHWKEGQKGRTTSWGKTIYNFIPVHEFDSKPRKNSKWLKRVGESHEERR